MNTEEITNALVELDDSITYLRSALMKGDAEGVLTGAKAARVDVNDLAKAAGGNSFFDMLDTTRAERDAALLDLSQTRAELVEAEKARDTALADLSQARAERDAAGMRWPQTVSSLEDALSTFPAGRSFLSRWTAAVARAEAAEASAAAMREALQFIDTQAEFYQHAHASDVQLCAMRSRVKEELEGVAGRALADRHAAELAQLRATVAASEAQTVDYAGRLGAADDAIAQLREENARLKADNTDWEEREAEARSTATAAADAYRAQQEEREELEAVYEAARSVRAQFPRRRSEWFSEQEELFDALAKVDARRGRGAK